MESYLTEENLQTFAIFFGSSFLAMFFAAATNKVTVFKNYEDLGLTLGMVYWPLIGLVILHVIAPEERPENYDILFGSTSAIITSILSGVLFLYSLVKTFINSVQANGLFIGILVGIFKVISSWIIILASLGFINRVTEKNRNPGNTLIFILIFTFIFKWILDILVNGEKVEKAKALKAA